MAGVDLKGSSFFDAYLKKLSIETNHVESAFLITDEVRYLSRPYSLRLIIASISQSTQDLIRRGIAEGVVNILPERSLQDPFKIKSILNDNLAVFIFSRR
jgi:hypothetical protein